MEVVIDSVGRIMVPKALRSALGMTPGTRVEISPYGRGLQVTPGGRTADLVKDKNGRLVGDGDGSLDDGLLFALIDAARR
ncbi:MAG: AbrB/MazE/SpoVT family DNA-binding domain-containing protein [Bifidobacteriaceae bacterium]|jgi:AbrB family looped-hinge helix DNA binding protein|nr:AbrB/MazE/SpoVT family DNA-binding domain-containing protein [Bifidobacteriaceae bacterium]